ncbi:MAG TPA: PKD domain-containing protein [Vicinamibacterales bacterium]|nr:PKD domain-containing protein [Vicinamibacterales bacterium]
MIPKQRQPRFVPPRRPGRLAALIVLTFALAVQGCDKVALVAPSGATITLFTNAQFLPINGSVQVTASVVEANGYPVQNGTTVTFTTSLGTMEPSEAKTQDGKATARLIAGQVSGTAEVNAFSGSNSAGATVQVLIGAAAAGTILVSASPSTIPSTGGTVNLVATVQDAGGNGLSGVPVNFTTDFGTLSPDVAVSDASGHARSALTTNQTATVTASAGGQSGTVTVTATAVPTLTITPPTTTPSVGVSASFTVNVQAGTNSSPIRNVTVNFGDGSQVSLGAATGSVTIPHTYLQSGNFTVTATATDSSGQSSTVSVPVDVFPAVPFTLEMSASSGRVGQPITVTATPPVGSPVITNYQWNLGPAGIVNTAIPTVTAIYNSMPCSASTCVVQLTVTATGADGRVGFGSTTTTITP